MNPTPPQAAGGLNRFLNAIEAAGNKLPHITMLFIWALVITLVISLALSYVSFDYRHPSTGAVIAVTNMLAPANLLDLVVNSVKNFMGFPPLGITLVATLGIGIAEGSGFIHTLLRKLMSYIPRAALTPAVVIVSILCHVASDSVYVILMPLAALMFYCAGRHPLAGVACSFAGLSGGFTASYTPSVIDPVMQSFTQAAAQTLDASYSVNVLCNYFFALGGTFFVIAACWYVTDKIVEPRLWATMPLDKGLENDPDLRITPVSALENSAYRKACTVFLGLAALLFVLCWPEGSMLRAPDGSLTSPKAPVMQAIVPLIFIFFSLPGRALRLLGHRHPDRLRFGLRLPAREVRGATRPARTPSRTPPFGLPAGFLMQNRFSCNPRKKDRRHDRHPPSLCRRTQRQLPALRRRLLRERPEGRPRAELRGPARAREASRPRT